MHVHGDFLHRSLTHRRASQSTPVLAAVIGVVVAADPAVSLPVQAICSYLSAANSGYCTTKARPGQHGSSIGGRCRMHVTLLRWLLLPAAGTAVKMSGSAAAHAKAHDCRLPYIRRALLRTCGLCQFLLTMRHTRPHPPPPLPPLLPPIACRSQMMSDPLTQQRVAGFSSLMDLLTLPVSRPSCKHLL